VVFFRIRLHNTLIYSDLGAFLVAKMAFGGCKDGHTRFRTLLALFSYVPLSLLFSLDLMK